MKNDKKQQTAEKAIMKCKQCAKDFSSNKPNQIYYTVSCQVLYNRQFDNTTKLHILGLSTNTIGAIAELEVCADLMRKGYGVFRAMSPHASCDLLAVKNNKFFRIEVRSGGRDREGAIRIRDHKLRAECLAMYLHKENKVFYMPDIVSETISGEQKIIEKYEK